MSEPREALPPVHGDVSAPDVEGQQLVLMGGVAAMVSADGVMQLPAGLHPGIVEAFPTVPLTPGQQLAPSPAATVVNDALTAEYQPGTTYADLGEHGIAAVPTVVLPGGSIAASQAQQAQFNADFETELRIREVEARSAATAAVDHHIGRLLTGLPPLPGPGAAEQAQFRLAMDTMLHDEFGLREEYAQYVAERAATEQQNIAMGQAARRHTVRETSPRRWALYQALADGWRPPEQRKA